MVKATAAFLFPFVIWPSLWLSLSRPQRRSLYTAASSTSVIASDWLRQRAADPSGSAASASLLPASEWRRRRGSTIAAPVGPRQRPSSSPFRCEKTLRNHEQHLSPTFGRIVSAVGAGSSRCASRSSAASVRSDSSPCVHPLTGFCSAGGCAASATHAKLSCSSRRCVT